MGTLANVLRFVLTLLSMVAVVPVAMISVAVAQDAKPRLVPSKVKASLVTSFAQDGKAVDIRISNPSEDWVVLEVSISGQYSENDPACIALKNRPLPPPSTSGVTYGWFCNPGFIKDSKIVIQPKAAGSVYVEIDPDRTIESVKLDEVRGREATLVERTLSKFR